MLLRDLKNGERAMISQLSFPNEVKRLLLANGLTIGSIVTMNYSPTFSALINLTVGDRMLSVRRKDAAAIEIVKF